MPLQRHGWRQPIRSQPLIKADPNIDSGVLWNLLKLGSMADHAAALYSNF